MAIQVRRGNEVDFDANKMLPGEWAVSLDTKYVRMCFAPGVCLRMATYDSFEQDMALIENILKECQSIEDAVAKIQTEVNEVAIEVEEFATSAEENALKSQSYAVGGTGTRENENIDNAKYYYNQVKQVSQSINGVIPMGTVAFADLPDLEIGDSAFMYNVSDAFTSDERFNDGGNVFYGAGNNVIWTAEGKWDVTASSSVNGVKGSAEEDFRTGNVTIRPEDLGLGEVIENMLKAETLTATTQFNVTADTIEDFFVGVGQFAIDKGIKNNDTMHLRGAWVNHDFFTILCTRLPSNQLMMLAWKNIGDIYLARYDVTTEKNLNTEHFATAKNLANYLPLTGGALSNTLYGPDFVTAKNNSVYGRLQVFNEGTAETSGLCLLTVGNPTPSGNVGNSRGYVRVYGTNTGYVDLYASAMTSNAAVLLPNKTGSLMLKEDFTIEDGVLTINLD